MARIKLRDKLKKRSLPPIPSELWPLIGLHLCAAPYAAFMLCAASKQISKSLRNDEWWSDFFERVIAYQKSLKISKFLRVIHDIDFMKQRKVLLLAFARKCHSCGSKYDHSILRGLGIRVCRHCLKKNLVSNGVLEFKYGLSFSDFVEEYLARDGLLVSKNYFFRHKLANGRDYEEFMRDPLLAMESRQYAESNFGNLYFMWRPHLQHLMRFDLEAKEETQRDRRKAAQFLSARLSRFIVSSSEPSFLGIPKAWVPGSSTYCYCFDCKPPKKLNEQWWRVGFNEERHKRLNVLLNAVSQNTLKKGRLDKHYTADLLSVES